MITPLNGHNLHSLYMHGQPLGVECRGCCRRSVAFAGEVEGFKGNMRELRTLRFVCSACGSREWAGWLFVTDADREAFLGRHAAGGPAF